MSKNLLNPIYKFLRSQFYWDLKLLKSIFELKYLIKLGTCQPSRFPFKIHFVETFSFENQELKSGNKLIIQKNETIFNPILFRKIHLINTASWAGIHALGDDGNGLIFFNLSNQHRGIGKWTLNLRE